MAVVIATGITTDGAREVLGLDVSNSEDRAFWPICGRFRPTFPGQGQITRRARMTSRWPTTR
jgi:hypothetical protein